MPSDAWRGGLHADAFVVFSTKFWGNEKERGANLKGHATRRSWVWQCWVRVVWRGGLHADAVVVFPKNIWGNEKERAGNLKCHATRRCLVCITQRLLVVEAEPLC
jgi:hypothetical protein